MGILQLFTLTLDYPHNRIGLKANDALATMQHDTSGLSLVGEADGLFVDYVEPKSVAALAGLHEGDVIVSLGYQDASSLDAMTALRLLDSAKAPIEVKVKRSAGAIVAITYPIASAVRGARY